MSALLLDQIDAAYGKKAILNNVSLAVEEGEIVALIGPNGAGKSTVLKVAAGLLNPRGGRVFLEGQDITALPVHRRIGCGLGYCIQGGRIFPSLTVRENLAIGASEMSTDEREESLAPLLDIFPNLKRLLDQRSGVLSGGERQALALAMSLIRRPKVLLLDEPSAGLSPRFVRALLGVVEEFNRDWRLAVLLVEQNIGAALSTAHRAVALAGGEVVKETERPNEWIDGDVIEKLFLGGYMS